VTRRKIAVHRQPNFLTQRGKKEPPSWAARAEPDTTHAIHDFDFLFHRDFWPRGKSMCHLSGLDGAPVSDQSLKEQLFDARDWRDYFSLHGDPPRGTGASRGPGSQGGRAIPRKIFKVMITGDGQPFPAGRVPAHIMEESVGTFVKLQTDKTARRAFLEKKRGEKTAETDCAKQEEFVRSGRRSHVPGICSFEPEEVFDIEYWVAKDVEEFIQTTYGPRMLNVYNKFFAYTFRADLARYLVLQEARNTVFALSRKNFIPLF
jgi:hypothetical protein